MSFFSKSPREIRQEKRRKELAERYRRRLAKRVRRAHSKNRKIARMI